MQPASRHATENQAWSDVTTGARFHVIFGNELLQNIYAFSGGV